MIKPQKVKQEKIEKQKEHISPQKVDVDLNEITKEEEEIKKESKKRNYTLIILILSALTAFLIGSIYDIYERFFSIFNNTPLLGIFYALSLFIFFIILIFIGIKEFKGYKKLKNIENMQKIAKNLQNNPTEEVFSFTDKILDIYTNHPDEEIRAKAIEIQKELKERVFLKEEVLEFLDERFFTYLDKKAYKLITKYSNQTALSTAISPVALIDMILILSRSWAMITEISKVYGFKPNFASKILLLKRVSFNLIFASVTDLASDYLSSIIGTSLLSKLSYHSAQGLANGVLIARIGVATINSCRVIYFKKRINYVEYIAKKLLETLLGRAQAKS